MAPTNWPLMTPAEVQAFGIELVIPYLGEEGFTVQAVNDEKSPDPQIVGQSSGNPACIFVRTAMYPEKGVLTPAEVELALAWAARQGATSSFASVGITCYKFPDQSEVQSEAHMSLPIRDCGFYVAYNGLLLITTSDRVNAWPKSEL